MRVLHRLIIAGAAAALVSAPVVAMERAARLETAAAPIAAQDTCRRDVRCVPEATPEYCLADNLCATALPASALVRYDALMDAAAGR